MRACVTSLLLTGSALARTPSLDAEPLAGVRLRIDGVLRDWPGRFVPLSEVVLGHGTGGDPEASVNVGYDEQSLYVALEVHDAKLVRSAGASEAEDHATLRLAFPAAGGGYTTHDLAIFPGDPGKVAGLVKVDGVAVREARVTEAPTQQGFDLEAQIPWSRIPEASRVRVGLRALVSYTDADERGKVKAVRATSLARTAPGFPEFRLEAEQAIQASLVGPKNLPDQPARQAVGNVSGDALYERVAVYGRYLTIVGPHYRGGSQFYFADLGTTMADAVKRLSLVDFDADGLAEIVVQKRVGSADHYREVLQIFKIAQGDAPVPVFSHEVALKTPHGRIDNQVRITSSGGAPSIEIAQGKVDGFEAATYDEPSPTDMPSVLLPWQSVGRRTVRWSGNAFETTDSQSGGRGVLKASRSGAGPRAARSEPPGPPSPPPPRAPTPDELLDRVYAMYRKERGVAASKPRFDFVTDVAGDAEPERVLVHGKDVVVFGKGFRAGTSYAFITIGVADPHDVLDVTARDLTGDGKAEIIVRGVLHAKASKALGGDVVTRHALFVYRVGDAALSRILAVETGRELGKQRILGAIAFVPAKPAPDIELRPGRAMGWTEQSYPFPPDTTAAGGLEPLLLPWGEAKPRRYHFDGVAFALE